MPMKRGDVLFLTKYTLHGSLPNKSDQVRWSFDLRYNPIGQPRGREAFPGFVACSRANPESELHDPETWAKLWYETRKRLAREDINRWDGSEPACA